MKHLPDHKYIITYWCPLFPGGFKLGISDFRIESEPSEWSRAWRTDLSSEIRIQCEFEFQYSVDIVYDFMMYILVYDFKIIVTFVPSRLIPNFQAWADVESGVQRAFASYCMQRFQRARGTRCSPQYEVNRFIGLSPGP